MDVNLSPRSSTNRPDGGDAGLEINLSPELRGSLEEWTFLLGSDHDARWLGSQGLNAVEWTRRDLAAAIGGRKLILVTPDDEHSQRFARDLGAKITDRGLATFRVWVLDGLGSRVASLQEWCEQNDFPAALAQDRPWEAAEKPRGGAGGFVTAPRAQPPRFTNDPRPIGIELLPVPRLDERLIPAPLRAWVADIAERGAFPLEYAASAAIVALSGLIGRRIALKPMTEWSSPTFGARSWDRPAFRRPHRLRRHCGRWSGWPLIRGAASSRPPRRSKKGGWLSRPARKQPGWRFARPPGKGSRTTRSLG
jgi:hypothetical protein